MFTWNLFSDVSQMLSYQFMVNAFEVGGIVSVVAGVVGYFVILRRTAFSAHALSHIGFAGAAGAVVIGLQPIVGLVASCVCAGGVIGALGQRLRDRDTVIGIVLAFALGLGALFLALYHGGDANLAVSILFGEILGVTSGQVLLTLAIGIVALLLIAAMYRPLLFSSVDEDVAEARGVPVRLLSIGFVMTVGLAVAVSVQVVGVLLIFALVVTPAAIAERVCRSPAQALTVGIVIALLSTWVGLFIAYFTPYPVSFFITAISFGLYLLVRAAEALAARVRRTSVGLSRAAEG
ncbi:MAG TPA: metal ABC transporter permease [Candidatus Dormibacteraeota bacterium]